IPGSDATPLTFTLNGAAGTQTLYIPIQSNVAPQVQSVTLSAASVGGGGTVQGTVTLSGSAPAGGAVVTLSASGASVPATITVSAGSMSATFTVTTSAVTSTQTATITASYAGSSAQATLSVTAGSGGPGGSGIAPFASLGCLCTFQPVGNIAGPVGIRILP